MLLLILYHKSGMIRISVVTPVTKPITTPVTTSGEFCTGTKCLGGKPRTQATALSTGYGCGGVRSAFPCRSKTCSRQPCTDIGTCPLSVVLLPVADVFVTCFLFSLHGETAKTPQVLSCGEPQMAQLRPDAPSQAEKCTDYCSR